MRVYKARGAPKPSAERFEMRAVRLLTTRTTSDPLSPLLGTLGYEGNIEGDVNPCKLIRTNNDAGFLRLAFG
jgi:hypothetical protein